MKSFDEKTTAAIILNVERHYLFPMIRKMIKKFALITLVHHYTGNCRYSKSAWFSIGNEKKINLYSQIILFYMQTTLKTLQKHN